MTQKPISDFFNTKPKKQAKIIKYCISKVTSETEDKEDRREKETKRNEKKTKEIMELLYNFHDLHEMVYYEEFYVHSYVEELRANCSISKTRKKLSLCKKSEIREHFATHKNYGKTARVFGLQDSSDRKICKAAPLEKTNKRRFGGLKGSFKGNKKEAGKSLSYPIEIDQEILVWLLQMMDPIFLFRR